MATVGDPPAVVRLDSITRDLCVCQLKTLSGRYGIKLPADWEEMNVSDLVKLVDQTHSRLRKYRSTP